eukprot:TRINITY_DN2272_c0_g1_i1.p1 TRINITY_DN2272_c0_g1~~TRINITY_DN2272_c0_g1_i1.p1  ORF type:complete len:652 (-),score=111.06 TRINITY_DN2272_c0_g1_i1:268-2223(-)
MNSHSSMYLAAAVFLAALVVAIPIQQASFAQRNFGPCDPIAPDQCAFPWPNNFFLKDDPSTPTGKRAAIQVDTFPKDNQGRPIDPAEWNTMDGFSASGTIMTLFPEIVDTNNLPHHWDMDASTAANSPTIILETTTGRIISHWAEIDMTTDNTTRRALLLQPGYRLNDNTRYIVALRNLKSATGAPIVASPGFAALRDRTPTDDYDIEGRRELFEDIFARLGALGWSRSSLQLAWDFTTASKESVSGRLVYARDDAFSRITSRGPAYNIVQVDDEFNANIFRRIRGTFTVPLYMNSRFPGSVLVLDGRGNPVYQGDVNIDFTVLIPRSLVNAPRPGRILQYGHGLFGGQGEVETGYLSEIANRYGYVLCATDWWGMSSLDVPAVLNMLRTDLSEFRILPDRTTQGIVNKLFLMKMMIGDFSREAAVTFNGVSVIDTNDRAYYGNSQGGILGGVYMAASTDVKYGCLGVPGAAYAVLLPRSVDFDLYFSVIRARYPDAADRIFIIGAMIQMIWDRAEPGGYTSYMTSNTLPNTPAHQVLFQYALHDSQVTYLGQYVYARSAGAVMFESNVRENNETLTGFQFVADTATHYGSALQGWDYGRPPVPRENIPPAKEYDTHEKPRREFKAQEQMHYFFSTGGVRNFCGGPCIGAA